MSSVLDMAMEDADTFKEKTTTDDDKTKIANLARQLLAINGEAAGVEEHLKDLRAKARRIEEEELPEAMDKIGMAKFTMLDGSSVSVKEFVRASLAEGRKDQVLDWLVERGHDSIIKTKVAVEFSKGELEIAREFVEFARGFNRASVDPSLTRDVNTATFKSLVTELLEKAKETGEVLPLSMLGVFIGRKAAVKTK